MPSSSSDTWNRIGKPLELSPRFTAQNRLSLAPMTNTLSNSDGTVSEKECDWLVSRAESGFGTVVTSGLASSLEGRNWIGQAGIYDDRFIPGLKNLAAARSVGTVMIAQLLHCGRRASASSIGRPPLGPSSGDGWQALTEAEIERTIQDYVVAAQRAIEAGFDGVEIHAAHGYLPAQFLSRTENTRCDRWGGSAEGRFAFPLEVVAKIRKALPAGAIVQLRLSAEDMRQSRGIDLDESAEVACRASALGADVISLSVWDVRKPTQKYPTTTPTAYVRERLPRSTPLVTAGKIWTPADAQFALDEGADQLAIGRLSIFNRDAPTGLQNRSWLPDRPPFSLSAFHAVGVPDKFVNYLREKWPEYVL